MKQVLPYLQKFKANEFLPDQIYRLTVAKDGIWLRGYYPSPFGVVIRDLVNIEHTYTVGGYLDDLIDFVSNNKQLEKKDDIVIDGIVIDDIDLAIYVILKNVIDNPSKYYRTKMKLDEFGNVKAELETSNGEIFEAYFVVIPFHNIIEIPTEIYCILHPTKNLTITLHYPKDDAEIVFYSFGQYKPLSTSDRTLLN